MGFHLAQCTPDDVPVIVSIYFAAFQNAFAVNAFPDVPTVRQWWTDMLSDEIKDPYALFLKVIEKNEADDEGTIIAWGKWNKPKPAAGRDEEENDGLPEWPEGGDPELSTNFCGQLAAKHAKAIKEPHWYLELLATSPAHQGRGAGSQILSHALQQADRSGHKAYLESAPEGVGLYRKFGFRHVDRVEVEIKGETYWNLCMIREPGACRV